MKPNSPDFKVINPASTTEVVEAFASDEKTVPLAGGTDLMVSIRYGNLSPCTLVNLAACEELCGGPKWEDDGTLVIKAMTTISDLRYNKRVKEKYPLLHQACRLLSVIPIQSRATWAGNITNASPCANGTAGLMVYDARLELMGPSGIREVALDSFYRDYKKTEQADDEFISAIKVPPATPGWRGYYRDVGAREYQAISKTLLTGRIKLNKTGKVEAARIVCGSVAPYTLRAVKTEKTLCGEKLSDSLIDKAASVLQDEIAPIDDIRSNRKYRRRVTENMLREFLEDNLPE
ncbi:MAG: FAD binding domain-containing protein [bacterium]